MITKIINKFDNFEVFVAEYFKDNNEFGTQERSYYCGSDTMIYLKVPKSRLMVNWIEKKEIAIVDNLEIHILNDKYLPMLEKMIQTYEQNHSNTVCLVMTKPKL